MSADEFWRDDPQLFVSYRTFYINKKQQEMEEMDYKCWLEGSYIHKGNGSLVSSLMQLLSNMFSNNKNTKEIPNYPDKPYLQIEKEKKIQQDIDKKQQEKEKKYEQFQKSLVYQGTLKQRYLESIKNKSKLQ